MDIGAWLSSHGLGEYKVAFAENRIDGDVLRELTDEDLRDLGVKALGDRKRLIAAIAGLGSARQAPQPPQPPETTAHEGERRQVTVLFADISGFTSLSERLGAEATHDVLEQFFEFADRIVEQFGGSIDKHIGDNLMALFGAPIAHGNDPERAVRAALAIHQAAEAVNIADGALRLHIGIANGQVVASDTGSDAHREYTVTGEAVNLAARLQDLAGPGQTLVSEPVHCELADLVSAAALEPRQLKGIALPVTAFRVEGLADGSTARRAKAFFGRRSELSQCSAILTQVAETGAGQAILLRGPPGIGKTHLADAVADQAQDAGFALHRILVLDFGSREGELPMPALVRALLGLGASASDSARQAAARKVLEDQSVKGDDEVFLNDLLDLPQPDHLRRVFDAMDDQRRREGRSALISGLTSAAARKRPQMILIEDLHWAEPETLEMLAAVIYATRELPVLILGTTRPEGDPVNAAWRSLGLDLPVSVIHLGPLRPSEAREMAASMAGEGDARLADYIERAAGNPLFLEQLIQNAADASSAVPGSISSLVLAQMDRLDLRERRALQAASVLGQRFELASLRYLIDDPDYGPGGLTSSELVRPDGENCLFSHALIRDGIYGSILTAARERLHLRAAEWFAKRDPALHAEHLHLARDPGAARAFLAAAQQEAANYRYERAIELLRKGKEAASTKADLAALSLALGEVALDTGAIKEAREAFDEALGAAEDDADRCRAHLGMAGVRRLTDEHDAAMQDLDAALAISDRLGLTAEAAQAHSIRGNLLFPVGDVAGCLREHSLALELARQAGAAEVEAVALGGLGDCDYLQARFYSALQRFTACVEFCRERGFGRIEVANLPMLAFGAMFCGKTELAFDTTFAALEAAKRVGHERAEMIAHHVAFMCFKSAGDFDRAKDHAQKSIDIAQSLGALRFEAEAQGFLAEAECLAGDQQTALDRIHRAIRITREVGMSYMGPAILGQVAIVTEDDAERRAVLAEGEALLAAGSVGHNHLFFRWNAIEACLKTGDFDEAERHAQALAAFCPEPEICLVVFTADCGVALAKAGRGEGDGALVVEIDRLIKEAKRMGQTLSMNRLQDAREALAG